jgi:gamma-glutamyltranspeptidase/glutathione hydrolase
MLTRVRAVSGNSSIGADALSEAVSGNSVIAANVAFDVLASGGNAFDAAAAAGLALQVVEPHQCGLGGEAVALLHVRGRDRPVVVCGQGVAPATATTERYRREGLTVIPGAGLMAAVVPGAFDAWMIMLRDFGSMSLRDVMQPALSFAERGFAINPQISKAISKGASLFRSSWPSSAAIFLPDDAVPPVGALLANPVLARTYARLLREAEQASPARETQIEAARARFYRGFIAEAVDKFVRRTPDVDNAGIARNGLLTGDDMAAWSATVEPAVTYRFRELLVHKAGPWSQGPVMLQVLAILKNSDIASLDPGGAAFVHLFVEAAKLAYADREAWYGDPGFVDVPMEYLLSDAYNDGRRRMIADTASDELRPGSPPGRRPVLPAFQERPAVAKHAEKRAVSAPEPVGGNTSQINVSDRFGNMVSASASGGWLTGSPIIPELGFALSSRGQMFWLQDGLASSLAPRKRPRTTLSPTLVSREGVPITAFGCRGTDKSDQWNAQFVLRRLDHAMSLDDALSAPNFYSEHWPVSTSPRHACKRKLNVSDGFDEATVADLRDRGHIVPPRSPRGSALDYCVCAVSREGPNIETAIAPSDPTGGAFRRER